MIVVGIDPGAAGAIAAIDADGRLIAVHDMPAVEVRGRRRVSAPGVAELLRNLAHPHKVAMVVTEELGAVPGSGSTGAYRFGEAVGVILGAVAGAGLPLTTVRPAVWTKALGVGADKGAHRQAAQRLWPEHGAQFARVKDDGRADAALLAHWWARAAG